MIKNYFSKLFLTLSVLFLSLSVNGQEVFDYTGSLQYYVVPADVYRVEIEATGAAGGDGGSTNSGVGGHGARMTGSFDVTPGETLVILVGEQGAGAQYVGGGGGGTFVWRDTGTELLLVAGGGGGAGATDATDTYKDGMDATITELGTNGNGIPDGAGTAGEGGTQPTIGTWSGGGAGWNSGGNDGSLHGCTFDCTGGQAITSGGAGGIGGGSATSAANGGYGGGGGGNARCGAVGGGGGGGYSGGGAGGEDVTLEYNGGGGGGSYNAGDDQDNSAGVGTGNGQAIITEICNPINVSYSVVEETMAGNGAIDITVTGGSGTYTYDWDNDGTGDFDDSEDLVGITGGTYTVVVKDESICDDVTEIIDVISVIGFEENVLEFVKVYPNPTKNDLMIELDGSFNYAIYAVDGSLIASGNGANTELVNLSELESGVYIFEIKNEFGKYTSRITKQ